MLTIQQKLKLLRQKHGLTQIQVAEALNCSVPAYSKLETGSTDVTDFRLRQLAELYKMKIAQIYNSGEPQDDEKQCIVDMLKEKLYQSARLISDLQAKLIELYEEKYKQKRG